MSAPETNALSPAPVNTTTRTSLSAANVSSARLAASHISSDTALSRSGLLKVTMPTPASLRASSLSVCVIIRSLSILSYGFGFAQRGDLARGEAEFFQQGVSVFAKFRRPGDQP